MDEASNFVMEWVSPEALKEHWWAVKDGVSRVARLQDDYLPEDIYMAVKLGQMNLHLGHLDGELIGFVVLQLMPKVHGQNLHIWIAYSEGKREDNILDLAFPTLQEWAKNAGAKKITFSSPRRGWERNKLGFKPTFVNYEVKL